MPIKRILFYMLIVFAFCPTSVGGQTITSPFSKEDLGRMQRMQPASPFDLDGGYRLLSAWESLSRGDSAERASKLAEVLFGKIYQLSPRWELGIDGVANLYGGANAYDGLILAYELVGAYKPSPGVRLVGRSAHRYALKRKRYQLDNHLLFFYAPMRSGLTVLSAGRTTYATSHASNEEEFSEAYITPLGGTNNLNHVERDYLTLRNALYLTSALRSSLELRYERRQDLNDLLMPRTNSLHGELRLSYDFSSYGISNLTTYPSADKLPRGFFAPELGLTYRWHHYLDRVEPTQRNTAQSLELSARMSYAFAPYRRIDWAVVGETILRGGASLESSDFLNLPLGSVDRRPISNTWSTGQHIGLSEGSWLWGRVNYGGGRLALAHIPMLRALGVDESLHWRGMLSNRDMRWFELGYSIGLGQMFRLGTFYGTDLRGSDEFALRLSVPLLFLLSRASVRY